MSRSTTVLAVSIAAVVRAASAPAPVQITLKDHAFTPPAVRVPAHERLLFEVTNQDATPSEFESSDLRVEKIVVPGGKIVVRAGPLAPGTYTFFDDYHPDQARGTVVAVGKQAGK